MYDADVTVASATVACMRLLRGGCRYYRRRFRPSSLLRRIATIIVRPIIPPGIVIVVDLWPCPPSRSCVAAIDTQTGPYIVISNTNTPKYYHNPNQHNCNDYCGGTAAAAVVVVVVAFVAVYL